MNRLDVCMYGQCDEVCGRDREEGRTGLQLGFYMVTKALLQRLGVYKP